MCDWAQGVQQAAVLNGGVLTHKLHRLRMCSPQGSILLSCTHAGAGGAAIRLARAHLTALLRSGRLTTSSGPLASLGASMM